MNVVRGGIIAIGITLFSLLIALFDVAYDAGYYESFQEEHEIPAVTERTQDELNQVNEDIIQYLKTGDSARMTKHFGERETAHMKDVYALFEIARSVALLSIVCVALLLFASYQNPRRDVFMAAWITQAILILSFVGLAIYASTHWDTAFTIFHEIFFNNSLWLLDPKTDLMIQMMPTPFFVGMAGRIGLEALLFILVFFVIWVMIRRLGHGKQRREYESKKRLGKNNK